MSPGNSRFATAAFVAAVALGWSVICGPVVHGFQNGTDEKIAEISAPRLKDNETAQDTEVQPASKRICTRGVFLNETGKCYVPKGQGPCGELMIITELRNNKMFGACTCNKFTPAGPTFCETRPTLFWNATNRCYFIFDQGPCDKGEWLVGSKDEDPKCQKIPCPEEYDPEAPLLDGSNKPYLSFTFEYQGQCYSTQTQGFCPSGEFAYFPKNSLEPKCVKEGAFCPFDRNIAGPGRNSCPQGMDPDNFGGCEPNIEFE